MVTNFAPVHGCRWTQPACGADGRANVGLCHVSIFRDSWRHFRAAIELVLHVYFGCLSFRFVAGQSEWLFRLSWQPTLGIVYSTNKKVKVAHTRLPSVEFRSWSRFLAVSLQVMWVINPTVGCRYFPPGLQLPPQPLRGLLPIMLLGEQRDDGCEQFA